MNKRFFLGLGVLAVVFAVTAISVGAGGSDLPADKQAIIRAQAEEQAKIPKYTPQPAETKPAATMAPSLNIVRDRDGRIPVSLFTQQHYRFTTVWSGGYHQVIAGAPLNDPEKGILYVIEIDPATSETKVSVIQAPSGTGSLTITGWEGNRLSLTSSSGTALFFDVTSGKFH